ncbi:MAG: GDYXXLXY domain-containing protein [Flavobacterium sp.]|uniref:GDYXXLXY domain-containing protein n=1 Tax=Flavobacterium sp. TaxID=239 RepID=UPI0032634DC2
MKNKSTYLILFIVVVIAQLFVPFQMISSQEDTLSTGKMLKFKTAPIDPYDAFRGKYIYLRFKDNKIVADAKTKKLNYNDEIFVMFKDSAGFALVQSVSLTEPTTTSDYVKAKVNYVDNNVFVHKLNFDRDESDVFVHIDYPFERYYMNEYKAQKAEQAYIENNKNIKNNVYAEVAIKNGVGVVKDVILDGISIKKYVNKK